MFAIGTTDLGGGQVCVVPADIQIPLDNSLSCDDSGVDWASSNLVSGIGTFIIPLQKPYLRLGTWRLLGDGQCLQFVGNVCLTPTNDAVSEPFTVTPCGADCDPSIAEATLQTWKDWAGGDLGTATTAFCALGTVWNTANVGSATKNYGAARRAGDWAEDRVEDKTGDLIGDIVEVGGGIGSFGLLQWGPVYLNIPTGYNDAVLSMGTDIVCKQRKMLKDIVDDPPTPDYDQIQRPVFEKWPTSFNTVGDGMIANAEAFHAYGRAQLTAVERYKGAVDAGATPFIHAQSVAIAENGDRAVAAIRRMIVSVGDYQVALSATPEGRAAVLTSADLATLSSVFQRVRADGFTTSEVQELRDLGLTDAMIAFYRSTYDRPIEAAPTDVSMATAAGSLVTALRGSIAPLQTLSNEAANVASVTNQPPDASFTAAPAMGEAPLRTELKDTSTSPDLDAITTISWDFGDGESASGTQVVHTFTLDGSYTVTETVCDRFSCDQATRTIAVGPNRAPRAGDDTLITQQDEANVVNVFPNDADPDGDALTVSSWTQPAHGSVSCELDGFCTYIPAAGYAGADSFTYTVSDGRGGTATATVAITVKPPNRGPVAVDDHIGVAKGATDAIVGVLANDSDPDGVYISITGNTDPSHGTVACNLSDCRYTPDAGYTGADSFTYTIADGDGVPATATANLDVFAPRAPITLRDLSTDFPSAVGIDYHEASNKVVVSINYSNGEPNNFALIDENGAYTGFSEIHGLSEEVKIGSVRSGSCQGGFKAGELFTGTGVPGEIARISPDGSELQKPWVTLPDEGGLMRGSLFQDRYCAFNGDLLAVTTNGGVWRITSSGAVTKLRQIDTHLEGLTTLPDDPRYGPWAGTMLIGAENQGRIYSLAPDGTLRFYELGISPEDFDLVQPRENFFGVAFSQGKILGAPASAFASMQGDIVIAQEGAGVLFDVHWNPTAKAFEPSRLAEVGQWEHVTFAPSGINPIPAANHPPVAADQAVTTDTGTAKTITLGATDADGDPLSFAIVTAPAHGQLGPISGNSVTYTPAAGYTGADAFTFKARDGKIDSNVATVSITVGRVNRAPVATDASITTPEDTAKDLTLQASDQDGDALTYTIASGPSHGTLTGTGANRTYTPAANYTGADAFTFKANDGKLDSNVATVSITVTPVNDPPTLRLSSTSTGAQYSDAVTPVTVTVSDIDSAPSNLGVEVAAPGLPNQLTLSAPVLDAGAGTATFTLSGRLAVAAGSYSVSLAASDTKLRSASQLLGVQVTKEDATVVSFSPEIITVDGTDGDVDSLTETMTVAEAGDGALSSTLGFGVGLANAKPIALALAPLSGPSYTCTATNTAYAFTGATDATASCTLANVGVDVYEATATIGSNSYFTGGGSGVVSVINPVLGFTTGGGHFTSGGGKINFGFNAKTQKNGQAQGSLLTMFHRADGRYTVKSNAFGTLQQAKDPSGFWYATMTGKATFAAPKPLPCGSTKCGNYGFTAYVEDGGEPGTGRDRFWIEVRDPAGRVVSEASLAAPAAAKAAVIDGGNIQVHH